MEKEEEPTIDQLLAEKLYHMDNFTDDLYLWRKNLKDIVRTTGMTNFDLLQENEFFRSFFPFVTSSDKMVINKLLGELKRLRK